MKKNSQISGAALVLFLFVVQTYAGYFLTWPQKGELLSTGSVTDSNGISYNVTILPGYLSMLDFSGDSWVKGWRLQKKGGVRFAKGLLRIPVSFRHFHEYITPSPWRGIGRGMVHLRDGEQFLFTDYMGRGVGKTWKKYMGLAARAQERRSFGWWFSYPWATIKGVVNTTLRYTTGIPASALVLSYGVGLRPAWELSVPVLKTGKDVVVNSSHATFGVLENSWGLAVNQLVFGVATPVSGYAWNTAVGVPMALIGKTPTPQSADGWWVVMEESDEFVSGYKFPDSTSIVTVADKAARNAALRMVADSIRKECRKEKRPIEDEMKLYKAKVDSLGALLHEITLRTSDKIADRFDEDTAISFPRSGHKSVWSENDLDSLGRYVARILGERYEGWASVREDEKRELIRKLVVYWTGTPFTAPSPHHRKKQDPNTLVQTEMEEILK